MSGFFKFFLNVILFLFFIKMIPSLIDGAKQTYEYFATPKTKVGVIVINKVLINSNHTIKSLRSFFKNKDIKAILIQMDCPGGAAGSAQAIYEEIKELKKEYPKPIVTLVENVCASGGYYIAIATDSIVATPSAFVGSIGVYIAQPYLKPFIEQFKLQYNFIKTGKYKTVGNPFVEPTAERTALLQGVTDDTYQQFITDVSLQRPQLKLNKQNEWAEGKIFTGKQALTLGMIDAIGSISVATKIIKDKAHISGEIAWIHAPKDTWMNKLFDKDSEDPSFDATAKNTIDVQAIISQVQEYVAKQSAMIMS